MTIADLFNSPTTFELDGESFRISEPGLLQQGEYQRWLEQLAFDAINSRTYQDEASKARSVRMHDQDCATGAYEWGSELCLKRMQTRKGLVKLIEIICREQGMTEAKADRLVEEQTAALIQVFRNKAAAGADDPKAMGATPEELGSPAAFLLSVLLTHPLFCPSMSSDASPTSS